MSTEISVEDSHIPFSDTNIKSVKPISTIGLIIPHNVSIRGCNRKCACRLWPQCSYYNKMKWKKSRVDEGEHTEIIWEYYNNIFRISYMTPDIFPNG